MGRVVMYTGLESGLTMALIWGNIGLHGYFYKWAIGLIQLNLNVSRAILYLRQRYGYLRSLKIS